MVNVEVLASQQASATGVMWPTTRRLAVVVDPSVTSSEWRPT